jgi:hypothetical protein
VFLNKPIHNYHEMHTIFVGGIAPGKFSMGSNEPLGMASPPPKEGANTQESDTILIDGSDKVTTDQAPGGKRKRSGLIEDELQVFSIMTEAVKDVAKAVKDNKPTDIHQDLY